MKCERAKLNMLRADAGELGSWRTRALARHLGTCVGCRHYRADLRQLADAMRVEPQPPLDRFAMQMLLNEARRLQAQRPVPTLGKKIIEFFQPLETPSPALRYALALATAVLLLASGVWLVRVQNDPLRTAWNDGVELQIDRLETSLKALSLDADGSKAGNNDVEAIARQLLAVEG